MSEHNPLVVDGWTERQMDRWAGWYISRARTPYTMRTWWWMVVNLVILVAAMFLRNFDGGAWTIPADLALVVSGMWAGVGIMSAMARRQTYRTGWLEGRKAMVDSLREARLRGMDQDEWMQAELERDLAKVFLQ